MLGEIRDFYDNDFAGLANRQANDSLASGNIFAQMADPVMGERRGHMNSLKKLLESPGDFASSPVYKFAYEQGLDNLKREDAASGRLGSGNRLAALMNYGVGKASQLYYPQANLLAKLAGYDSSSPAAGALSASHAFGRSQDQQSMGAAAKAYGNQPQGQQGAPWWMSHANYGKGHAFSDNPNALPSGGSIPYMGGYSAPKYSPSQGAGTGYMQSDFGTTGFGPSGGYDNWDVMGDQNAYGLGSGGFDQEAYAEQDYWGYE
jgi:hypothetical protein